MIQARSIPTAAPEVDVSRYDVERKLGEGSTGAVFLARDRETGDLVALKKLFRMDAKSVLRLKREFRSLVDVANPHIVKLYDMGRDSDCWFLTMEYLDGVELTTYLTTRIAAEANDPRQAQERVLEAFRQLARGIQALHQAGMLHRDLKPSNVLVVGERVVVLDFGLVRELREHATMMTEDGTIAGTPAFMAPEQIRGAELSSAADWYAFGVMLYHALSGILPFEGSLMEILRRKLDGDPPPLRQFAPTAPAWLEELCTALLRRDPTARPSGDEIVATLDNAQRSGVTELPRTSTDTLIHTEGESRSPQLFGRHAELTQLSNALVEAERGRAVIAHIRGSSGTGKSALVERFLAELETRGNGNDVLVLRSRCYELEQMPFKALDAVLDALVRHLLPIDDVEVAHLLPEEILALTQLFPVLERLRAVKRLMSRSKNARDAMNERQHAELALRQLLERLARRQPIVLFIDDLQWGDLDSARILRSWIQEPTHAPILFVFSYRSDEIATSSCLSSMLRLDAGSSTRPASEHIIDVTTLANDEIHALCEQRLGTRVGAQSDLMTRIVREAQGNPFLASQLTTLAEAKLARGEHDLESLSIDALVAQTSAMLPAEAQTLLAVLAVAGRPMVPKLALRAAGVRHNGRAMVHALRSLNLVRTRDVSGTRMLEIYHDRIRERVHAALSAEQQRQLHLALLETLEFNGQVDPDWLFSLALGAGRSHEALLHGRAAAERANASLAFERAADVYGRCVEIAPEAQLAELWSKLALALVRCRRGVKAAEAYLEAAQRVSPAQAAQLRQLAASHLLRTGHFEQAERLMREVLEAMDSPVPTSDAGVLAAIAWERARIKLRGMKYTPRTESAADPALLARYDAFNALSAASQQYDLLRSALLQARALHCALEAGEPNRIVRALCLAAMAAATSGSSQASQQSDALLARAQTLSQDLPERAYGAVCAARTVCAYMLARFKAVLEPSFEADRILRAQAEDDPNGEYYRRFVVATVRVGTRFNLGQIREGREEMQELTREAHATDNRSLLLQLTLNHTVYDVSDDRAQSSWPRLHENARALPENRFGVVHVLHLAAVLYTAGATRDFAQAHSYLEHAWKQWLRSPVRRGGNLSYAVHAARAWMLLNQYFTQGRNPALLASVRQDRKALLQNPVAPAAPATRIEARLAYAAGDSQRALTLFRTASELSEAQGMLPDATRDLYAMGALLGGTQGETMQAAALERLREFGVVNPDNDVRAFVPELA